MWRSPLNILYLKEVATLLYSEELRETLFNLIDEMAQKKEAFVKNPEKDFTRNRKQSFQKIFHFILSMENDAIKRELMKYFNFSSDAPTDAAFNMQRGKIKTTAFEYLFHEFSNRIQDEKNYKGYKLLACDGSSLYISRNPKDKDTFIHEHNTMRGFNMLHLNTLYDLCNRKYTDAVIQPAHGMDERDALCRMVQRAAYRNTDKTILIADRGYSSLRLFAYIDASSYKYVIRFKESSVNNIAYGIKLPDSDTYDFTKEIYLTHSRKKELFLRKDKHVKYICKKTGEDEFDAIGKRELLPIKLRFVKFPLKNNTYEILVTNLSEQEFSSEELKVLYNMRWGIESSYKELKYAAGLIGLHSKKREYIEQEVWARLILFNYSEAIAMRISVEKRKFSQKLKYKYQLNFTTAIYLCRLFLRKNSALSAITLESTIENNILPVRQGRNAFRVQRPAKPASFCYRTA